MHFTCAAQIKTETECADSVKNCKSTSGKENLAEAKIAENSNELTVIKALFGKSKIYLFNNKYLIPVTILKPTDNLLEWKETL